MLRPYNQLPQLRNLLKQKKNLSFLRICGNVQDVAECLCMPALIIFGKTRKLKFQDDPTTFVTREGDIKNSKYYFLCLLNFIIIIGLGSASINSSSYSSLKLDFFRCIRRCRYVNVSEFVPVTNVDCISIYGSWNFNYYFKNASIFSCFP